MEKLIKTLQFLRLVDHNQELSLTNIALMGTLVFFATHDSLEPAHMLTLAATMTGYQLKRFAAIKPIKADQDIQALQETVASLESKVVALQMQGSMRHPQR